MLLRLTFVMNSHIGASEPIILRHPQRMYVRQRWQLVFRCLAGTNQVVPFFEAFRRFNPSRFISRGTLVGTASRPEYQCRVLLKAVATPFFGGEPYEKRPSFRPISVVIALWISALHIGARAIDGKRAGMLAFFASRSDAVRAFHVGVCAAHFAFYIRSALVAGM